jgi:hypothetical protein
MFDDLMKPMKAQRPNRSFLRLWVAYPTLHPGNA